MYRLLKDRLWDPIVRQLTQGVSPERLALAVALGAVLGVFPFLGTTTALCALAAAALKLNQPAVQAANWAAAGPQLLLIPLFVKGGERLFGLSPVSFDPVRLPALFGADPAAFLAAYGRSGLAGAALWALAAPAAGVLFYFLLRRGFRTIQSLPGHVISRRPHL